MLLNQARSIGVPIFIAGAIAVGGSTLSAGRNVAQVVEPPKRKAGVKVAEAKALVEKLKNEAKVIA